MAVDWSLKETNYTHRFSDFVVAFLKAADEFNGGFAEFVTDGYGQDGANQLTDAAVQSYLPSQTSLTVAQAEGAANTILQAIAANRGYLELMRP